MSWSRSQCSYSHTGFTAIKQHPSTTWACISQLPVADALLHNQQPQKRHLDVDWYPMVAVGRIMAYIHDTDGQIMHINLPRAADVSTRTLHCTNCSRRGLPNACTCHFGLREWDVIAINYMHWTCMSWLFAHVNLRFGSANTHLKRQCSAAVRNNFALDTPAFLS